MHTLQFVFHCFKNVPFAKTIIPPPKKKTHHMSIPVLFSTPERRNDLGLMADDGLALYLGAWE